MLLFVVVVVVVAVAVIHAVLLLFAGVYIFGKSPLYLTRLPVFPVTAAVVVSYVAHSLF